jgi:hemin uptake protein HemP
VHPVTGAAAPGPAADAPPPRYSSAQLFGPAVEVEIEHRAQVYRLRRTAMGKLILTK